MYKATPIPESATIEDPLWTARFHDLANAMVLMSTRPKIISRYTGLSPRQVTERYVRLTNDVASPGRMGNGHPKRFAIPHDRGGLDWTIQSAVFTNCYLELEAAMGELVNRGWLLATTYHAYCRLTEPAFQETKMRRLTINAAYDLMTHVGFGQYRKRAALAQQQCECCGTHFLVVTEAELDNQHCPMCALDKNYQRLVENSAKLREQAVQHG
ncbi:MAG: hypothetical protein K8H75_15645 [Sulfuricella sp.]|jgi:hypothetical protein|nr:hypothetical protein [Sulfuricella sp.]